MKTISGIPALAAIVALFITIELHGAGSLVGASRGRAVSGSAIQTSGRANNWQYWAEHTPTALVNFRATNSLGTTNIAFALQLNGSYAKGTNLGCGLTAATLTGSASVTVMDTYSLVLTGKLSSCDIILDVLPPQDYQVGTGKSPDVVAKKFKLFINGIEKNSLSYYTNDCNATAAFTNTIEVKYDQGSSIGKKTKMGIWSHDEINDDLAIGDGGWLAMGPGKSTNAAVADVRWSVAMGRLWDGKSAGRLQLTEAGLSLETFTPKKLIFSTESPSTNELQVLRGTNGIRQIRAVEGFADVVATNYQYEIRFYNPINVSTNWGGSGLYTILTNSPFVTWRIRNPDQSVSITNRLEITEERNGLAYTNLLSFDTTNKMWRLVQGNASLQKQEERWIYATNDLRYETNLVRYVGGATSFKAIEKYRKYDWAWEIDSITTDPDLSALVKSFEYYTNSAVVTSYRQLRGIYDADGNWEIREYFPFFDAYSNPYEHPGALQKISRPWKDSSTNDLSLAHVSNYGYAQFDYSGNSYTTHEMEMDYAGGSAGGHAATYFDNSVDSKVGNYYVDSRNEGNLGYGGYGMRSTTVRYTEEVGFYLNEHLKLSRQPNGTQQSFYYVFGTYDSAGYSFTEATNGIDWKMGSVNGTPGVPGYDTEWLDGQYVDAILLAPKQSTKEVSYSSKGQLVQKDTSINTSGTNFSLIDRLVYKRDALGHLTNITRIDPVSSSARIAYSADWIGPDGKVGGLKQSETDQSGIQTVYTYDSFKRATSSTKKGLAAAGGFPAQSDIVSEMSIDASGRKLSDVTRSGSLGLTNTYVFDLAGRLVSQTDPLGVTTTNVYSNGGRTVSSTTTGGGTKVIDNYLDRRTKSVTGNSVVAQYFDYDLTSDSNGSRPYPKNITKVTLGSVNGVRWTRDITSTYKLPAVKEMPSAYGTNTFKSRTQYETTGLIQSEYVTSHQLSESPDYVENRHNFDSLGHEISVTRIVDVNLAGYELDRINGTVQRCIQIGPDWFLTTTNTVRTTEGDPTETVVGLTKQRLTGLAANVISESHTVDFDGNDTVETVYVDRTAKQVTKVTDLAQSTLNATNITINGLVQSESTPSVVAPSKVYCDALGRQTNVTSSLGFSQFVTLDVYGQKVTQTDFAGNLTTFEYYPNTHTNVGQIKSTTSPAGKKTYFSYNPRNQLTRTWGDVPYPEEHVYNDYGDQTELHTYRGGSGWTASTWPASPGTADVTYWYYHEPSGMVTNKTDAQSRSVLFTYYKNNELCSKTWSRGVSVTNLFDPIDNPAGFAYSDSTPSVTYTNYNRTGLPTAVIDATGTHTVGYDAIGRMLTDEANGITFQNHFDPVYGRDYLQLDGVGTTLRQTFGFDPYGRMNQAAFSNYVASYTFVANSDLLLNTFFYKPSATLVMTTSRTYDYGFRLKAITNISASSVNLASHAYQYDNLNRRTSATREDSSSWGYAYDDRDEVVSGNHYWSDTSYVAGQQFSYGFDSIGNRTSATSGGDQWGANRRSSTYTANSLNQYTDRTVPGYLDIQGSATNTATVNVNGTIAYRHSDYFRKELAYDNSSAPLYPSITNVAILNNGTNADIVSTNIGNLFLRKSAETFSYDADGNLTNDGRWIFTWDAENRLTQMESKSDGPTASRQKIEFTHDQMGRRYSKKVSNWNGSGYDPVSTNRFYYDGWNLIGLVDAPSGLVQKSFLWGRDLSGNMQDAGGIGGLLAMVIHDSSTNVHFAGFDGNGNVSLLMSATGGEPSALYDYSAFGETLKATGPFAKANPFRFSTKFADDESDLLYYGYRYYRPSLGRWINRDPIEEDGGINLYGFVLNNAANGFDLLGMTKGGKQKMSATGWENSTPGDIQKEIDRLILEADPKKRKHIKALESWKKIRQSPVKYENKFGPSKGRGTALIAGGILTAASLAYAKMSTSCDIQDMRQAIDAGMTFDDQSTAASQLYDFIRHADSGDTAEADLDAVSYALLQGNGADALVIWDTLTEEME